MLNTVGRFIYTKYRGIMYVWALWEDLIYTKYWGILYVEHWENLLTQNTGDYFLLNIGNIYLHKILGNTLCWNTGKIY